MTSTERDLQALHNHYVEAVNIAVADDDYIRVDRLAAEYDTEVTGLRRQADKADKALQRAA